MNAMTLKYVFLTVVVVAFTATAVCGVVCAADVDCEDWTALTLEDLTYSGKYLSIDYEYEPFKTIEFNLSVPSEYSHLETVRFAGPTPTLEIVIEGLGLSVFVNTGGITVR